MSRVVIYEVTGMTCGSCERLIGNVLKDVAGVTETEVSLKKRRAAIRLQDGAKDPDLALVNAQLIVHGHTLYPKGRRPAVCDIPGKRDPFVTRLKRALAALGVVGLLFVFLGPLRQIVPSAATGASLGAMFALGLVASVSSCLASTGGFLLAYTSKAPSRSRTIAVHLGRLAAFLVGGAALGAIGGALPQGSTLWYGLLGLVLGIGFLVVALNLLDLSPSLARLGIRLPARFHAFGDRVASSQQGFTPFLVGAVTFILPCGFTQTAQALALASGSAQQGLLLMMMFALGTLPVLAGVTFFGSAATLKHRALRLGVGAALAFFAFGQIDGGLTVLGSPVTPSSLLASFGSQTVEAAVPSANAQEQVVKMTVAYGTYQPKNLTVKKGIPVRWEIDGKDISGCASSIVVPSYGIQRALVRGQNIITFTPKDKGTIPFSCSMGMIRGSFTVTD